MRRVLLLNVTYEPLTTVGLRRAVCLVLGGKAEVVHDDVQGAVLHAASVALATPSVIRLRRYVRVPYRNRVPLTRAALMRRDNYRCAYCGRRAETIDHVIPRSRGGAHAWENCVASCTICNHRKADRLLEELGWTLPVPPVVPRGAHWRLVGAQHDGDPQWAAYLREPSAALRTGKPALPYRTVRRTARPRRTRLRLFSFGRTGHTLSPPPVPRVSRLAPPRRLLPPENVTFERNASQYSGYDSCGGRCDAARDFHPGPRRIP